MKSRMKLICTFWLLVFSGIFVCSVSNAESAGSTLTFRYDEQVQVRIGYDEASLLTFDYDSASTLLANERENLTAGKEGIFADLDKFNAAKTLPVPKVTDPKLGNLVNDLYKGAKGPNPIGTGSTADAVRNELATGMATHGKFHSQKAQEYINALSNWRKKNPNASHYDQMVAESLKRDLQSGLGGN